MKTRGRIRWLAAAAAFVLVAALFGCAVSRQQAAVGRLEAVAFMAPFMERVLADDWEGAFADIDIDTLVNYGLPQGEFYRHLPGEKKTRYRRDFIQGIYLYLYGAVPREKAGEPKLYLSEDPLAVEVSGKNKDKRLHFHLKNRSDGLKIVRIEKAAGPPPRTVPSPGG
jgi:hypothetical protein